MGLGDLRRRRILDISGSNFEAGKFGLKFFDEENEECTFSDEEGELYQLLTIQAYRITPSLKGHFNFQVPLKATLSNFFDLKFFSL